MTTVLLLVIVCLQCLLILMMNSLAKRNIWIPSTPGMVQPKDRRSTRIRKSTSGTTFQPSTNDRAVAAYVEHTGCGVNRVRGCEGVAMPMRAGQC